MTAQPLQNGRNEYSVPDTLYLQVHGTTPHVIVEPGVPGQVVIEVHSSAYAPRHWETILSGDGDEALTLRQLDVELHSAEDALVVISVPEGTHVSFTDAKRVTARGLGNVIVDVAEGAAVSVDGYNGADIAVAGGARVALANGQGELSIAGSGGARIDVYDASHESATFELDGARVQGRGSYASVEGSITNGSFLHLAGVGAHDLATDTTSTLALDTHFTPLLGH